MVYGSSDWLSLTWLCLLAPQRRESRRGSGRVKDASGEGEAWGEGMSGEELAGGHGAGAFGLDLQEVEGIALTGDAEGMG